MNNWKEYIEFTFNPISDFLIEDNTGLEGNGIYSLVHKLTGTRFDFIYPNDNWTKLSEVQYYNHKTEGSSGKFCEAEFNEETIKDLTEFLEPALIIGWSSKDFYLFRIHYHSKTYFNKNFQGKCFKYYTGFGCLWLPLFPLLSALIKLMDLKLISGMEEIVIEPVY